MSLAPIFTDGSRLKELSRESVTETEFTVSSRGGLLTAVSEEYLYRNSTSAAVSESFMSFMGPYSENMARMMSSVYILLEFQWTRTPCFPMKTGISSLVSLCLFLGTVSSFFVCASFSLRMSSSPSFFRLADRFFVLVSFCIQAARCLV